MVQYGKPNVETAIVFRAVAASCVSLMVLAIPAIAQCPDGTPPPCTRPARPESRAPRLGVASIRVLTSTPVAGTTLKWQDLEKGVPLHVVVEHAVQRVPAGQRPVLAAFVNLTPGATREMHRRVLEARPITTRPTQRGLDWVLTTEHVREQRITVEIHVAFSPASDTSQARGLRLSFDWAASITLEFPVADSIQARSLVRGANRSALERQLDVEVVGGPNVAHDAEPDGAEVRSEGDVAQLGVADGAHVDRVDPRVFLWEVHRPLEDRQSHAAVVVGRAPGVGDDEGAVGDDRAGDREAQDRMERGVGVAHRARLGILAFQVEQRVADP